MPPHPPRKLAPSALVGAPLLLKILDPPLIIVTTTRSVDLKVHRKQTVTRQQESG